MSGLVVFAYDFPHRKSQEVLTRLHLDGHKISHVVAAPKVKLPTRAATVRRSVRRGPPLHPRKLALRVGAQYHVVPHGGQEIVDLLREISPEVGLIAGARLLPTETIEGFSQGVVNLHPGLIPEARGLDAFFWSILKDVPPGVTGHVIDPRVDAGTILVKRALDVQPDDTILDVAQRISDAELDIITPSLEALEAGRGTPVPRDARAPETRMTAQQERRAEGMFKEWIERHARAEVAA